MFFHRTRLGPEIRGLDEDGVREVNVIIATVFSSAEVGILPRAVMCCPWSLPAPLLSKQFHQFVG